MLGERSIRIFISTAMLSILGLAGVYLYVKSQQQNLDYLERRALSSGIDVDRMVDERLRLNRYEMLLELLGAATALVATIPILLRYLRSPEQVREASESLAIRQMQDKLSEMSHLVVRNEAATVGIDSDKLIGEIRNSIVDKLATEVQNRYSAEAQQEVHVSLMREMFHSDSERLHGQISLLRKRGNLNLAIGVATTLLAAGVLVLMVSGINSLAHDPSGLLAYYIPRVSTVIFVEVF